MGHFQHNDGDEFGVREIDEQYSYLSYDSISPAISTLRRAGLLEQVDQEHNRGIYTVTDRGFEYIEEHGKPTRYRLPE